jgi:hypothetical protein
LEWEISPLRVRVRCDYTGRWRIMQATCLWYRKVRYRKRLSGFKGRVAVAVVMREGEIKGHLT